MALTKANLTARLYEEIGLYKREAREIVEDFFEEIRAALESDQPIKISGFGNFDLLDKTDFAPPESAKPLASTGLDDGFLFHVGGYILTSNKFNICC